MSPAPVCVVVLDGWGLAEAGPGNAVELAQTPVFDRLWREFPHTTLQASGRAVGLPDGQMGNSEVGHTNLGAGRVVRQDLVRIDDDIDAGTFAHNPALRPGVRARPRLGAASHRPAVRRRGAQPYPSPPGTDRGGRRRRGRPRVCARLHRRPRRVAHQRRRLCRPDSGNRDGQRALLGDGSRPPLGSHQTRLRRDRARSRGVCLERG